MRARGRCIVAVGSDSRCSCSGSWTACLSLQTMLVLRVLGESAAARLTPFPFSRCLLLTLVLWSLFAASGSCCRSALQHNRFTAQISGISEFGHPLTIACSTYSNSSTVRAWICSMETPTKPLRSLICCCYRRTVCSLPDIQRAGLRSSIGRTCQARGRRRRFCRCSRSSRCRKPCRCSRSRRCRELGFECS